MAKEYKSVKEKDFAEKMASIEATLGYIMGTDTINDVLNKLDDIYIDENKIKKIDEKICFYADKIRTSAQFLMMRKIHKGKKYEDVLAITNYIQQQINKINEIIEKEVNK